MKKLMFLFSTLFLFSQCSKMHTLAIHEEYATNEIGAIEVKLGETRMATVKVRYNDGGETKFFKSINGQTPVDIMLGEDVLLTNEWENDSKKEKFECEFLFPETLYTVGDQINFLILVNPNNAEVFESEIKFEIID